MSERMLEMVIPARSPPGTCQTATASTTMIAMLRRCLPPSGPTTSRIALGGHASGLARGGGGSARPLDGGPAGDVLGSESVADPEVGVDVAPVRRDLLELLAQLAHEDVHRAVAVDHRVAPDALVDLLAGNDLAAEVAEQRDQLELAAGEVHAAAGR